MYCRAFYKNKKIQLMAFDGVVVGKSNGNLNNGSASTDGVMCLVIGCAVPTGVTHETIHKLRQLKDVEDLGFTAAHDVANTQLVHFHVSEFFRLAPDGVGTLYLIPAARGTAQKAAFTTTVKNLIRNQSDIKCIGVAGLNYVAADASDIQVIIDGFNAVHPQIDALLLEGTGDVFMDDATPPAPIAVGSYLDLRLGDYENVSVVIGQDAYVATYLGASSQTAAIGTALGGLAIRKIAENLGSVDIEVKPAAKRGDENYTLTDVTLKRFEAANLSNGVSVSTLSATDMNTLRDKGYIFVGSFVGYAGYYFSGSPTGVPLTSDYCYIERNRIWNKVVRTLRTALIPKVRSRLAKNPDTGDLLNTTTTYLENLAETKISDALGDNISGVSVSIATDQQVNENTPLEAVVEYTFDDILYKFDVTVGAVAALG